MPAMEARTIAGLLLALITVAAVFAVLLYATRERRAERRSVRRGERMRLLRNEERIAAERAKAGGAA